jgi:succinate dehydrogenase (ubiquinone) cytochrome b560 subunit
MLSGTFYVFSLTYLASLSPTITSLLPFSLDLSSASLASAFGAWPWAVKLVTKFTVSLPFTLHAFNGGRYLLWDLGLQMGKTQVVRTGLVVTALAVGSAGWLAVM